MSGRRASCILAFLAVAANGLTGASAWVEASPPDAMASATSKAAPNAMHPAFAPLDSLGIAVLVSGKPPSSVRTCGACHDVEAINAHNDHWTATVRAECVSCHLADGRFPEDRASYESDGRLRREALRISGPRDERCAACHGIVHTERDPLRIPGDFGLSPAPGRTYALTLATGEILSGQNISESYLNLAAKGERAYPWDAHARRLVSCVDCHHAANNPLKADMKRAHPGFLLDDPRRIGLSEYLRRPDHRLAAPDCRSCHDPLEAHDFLPYRERHFDVLDCGACHMPEMLGPAARTIDSTVVTLAGAPALIARGYEPGPDDELNVRRASGYAPLLEARRDSSGRVTIAPYHIVETFGWRNGATDAPVPWDVVKNAYLVDGRYAPEISDALDTDGDAEISAAELRLDAHFKVAVVRGRLAGLGVDDPRPARAVTHHEIHHGVLAGAQALRDCGTCHARGGRVVAGIELSPYTPAGLESPRRIDPPVIAGLHIFAHTQGCPGNAVGFGLFAAVVLGVMVHAGIRIATRSSRAPRRETGTRAYLYSAYERIWHWLMAGSVLVLMVTGLRIHLAGDGAFLPMTQAVAWHNAFGIILAANGFLSLFYHVTTNAIRRFLPSRGGIVPRVLEQVRFYTSGIFLGRPHPSPKTAERRLNPLQQITYLALLNVLFPLQVATGILIWGASRWPALAGRVGGTSIVAPVHNMGAWLFLVFLVLHLYLTTTGHTVFSSVRAMIDGHDVVHTGAEPERKEIHV